MTLLRNTVRVVAAAAWLAGCGSTSTPIPPSYASSPSKLLKYSKTFHYEGAEQTFDVPEGVHVVTISATGANGAGRYHGNPGRVRARVPVTPGETLAIFVGGDGGKGGYNGGGSGSTGEARVRPIAVAIAEAKMEGAHRMSARVATSCRTALSLREAAAGRVATHLAPDAAIPKAMVAPAAGSSGRRRQ